MTEDVDLEITLVMCKDRDDYNTQMFNRVNLIQDSCFVNFQ